MRILIIILTFLPSVVWSQSNIKFDIDKFKLGNGLKVVIYEDKAIPNVIVGVKYNFGAKNELEGKTGMAHFIEHLQFHGTKNIPQGDFSKIIMKAGGYCNAYTHYDFTYFYSFLPAHQYKIGLWTESERMLHPVLESESFERERNVVLQEKNLRYQSGPLANAFNDIQDIVFPYSSYGHSIIGTEQDLNSITMRDVNDFRKKYYSPCNACLVIAGNVDRKEVKKWVHYYFDDIPTGIKIPKVENIKIKLPKNKVINKYPKDLKHSMMYITYITVPEKDKDNQALSVLKRYIVPDATRNILKKNIAEKDKTIKRISISNEPWGEVGLFKIKVQFEDNMDADAITVAEKIQNELDKIHLKKIKNTEFEALKNQISSEFFDMYFDSETIADQITDVYFDYGNVDRYKSLLNDYLNVSKKHMQKVISKYLNRDNRIILIYNRSKE